MPRLDHFAGFAPNVIQKIRPNFIDDQIQQIGAALNGSDILKQNVNSLWACWRFCATQQQQAVAEIVGEQNKRTLKCHGEHKRKVMEQMDSERDPVFAAVEAALAVLEGRLRVGTMEVTAVTPANIQWPAEALRWIPYPSV